MTQMTADENAKRDPQTYAIIGACMQVHGELGGGFLEAVYQEAIAVELAMREIPFVREHSLRVTYRGQVLSATYQADFICFGTVILELKALRALDSAHEAQVINYLKATGLNRALLVNFGATRLQYERFAHSEKHLSTSADKTDSRQETFADD